MYQALHKWDEALELAKATVRMGFFKFVLQNFIDSDCARRIEKLSEVNFNF